MSKIAVIGSGYWGKNLIRNYYQLGVLKIICDKNESILSNFKEQYPDVETCMALSDVLNQKEIDGVVIATPAETHYDLAREALLADKHVYVEKPLVLDEKQGEDLIALAKDRKRVLMVGHLLQYHPAFVCLKEMVHSGELGRINYIYSNRLNLGKIRREENILWSFAPHDISMILCLAGETASNVSAVGGFYLHKKIADVTTTHLEFPSGLQSHIFVSWLHPFKEQKLVVVGEQKMAVFDDTLPWSDKLQLFSHKINWQSGMPVPAKAEPESVEINQGEPLRAECEHFLHCLKSGSEPVTDGKEGLQVLKILTAAQQSMDSGGCKITLQSADINTILHKSSEQALQSSPQSSIDHDSVPYFVHETAVIDSNCKIGSGSKIWHFSHILSNSEIGEKCNIGQNVSIGPEVKIGNNCKIQNNVSVYKGVTLEDGVFCGPSMVFTNIYNPRAEISKMDQVRPTLVKHGATLGANCTIICGVTIGRYAFVGAGAVVTHNVPDHAMVAGNTARAIGWACTCGERLTDNYECQTCGRFFMRTDQGLKEKP